MDAVLGSFAYVMDYLRDQVSDIRAADMVAQPPGIANHPAWVIGHLTFSCQALGGQIEVEPWLPDDWATRFGMGSLPVADLSVYESKETMLEIQHDAEDRIVAAIRRLSPTQLDAPLPEEKYHAALPSVRQAVTQLLVAHSANHIGQLTVWRRLMKMPPLSHPFL